MLQKTSDLAAPCAYQKWPKYGSEKAIIETFSMKNSFNGDLCHRIYGNI